MCKNTLGMRRRVRLAGNARPLRRELLLADSGGRMPVVYCLLRCNAAALDCHEWRAQSRGNDRQTRRFSLILHPVQAPYPSNSRYFSPYLQAHYVTKRSHDMKWN